MPASPVATAIAALELERENLAARLQKVNAAIVSMRELFHLPKSNGHAARTPKPRRSTAAPAATAKGAKAADAIRDALRRGPLSPGALAAELDMLAANVSYHVRKLEGQGVLKASGTGMSRRYALADGSAKEAP